MQNLGSIPIRFSKRSARTSGAIRFTMRRRSFRPIAETSGQEIATHTFSHYYCLEAGQTEKAFEADLQAAAAIGEPFGRVTESLVFPRGQYNPAYSSALVRQGVRAYRIPPRFFPYRPRRADEENLAHRGLRLLDSYVPLGGSHGDEPRSDPNGVVPLRAGLFLRPYSTLRRRLDPMRIHRIKGAMRDAARRGRDFHLWWHPHNFGTHTGENLAALNELLDEYRVLRERFALAESQHGGSGSRGSGSSVSRQPRILALAAYPERSGATRFRLTQMLPYLKARGWDVRFEPFFEDDFFSGFYAKGNRLEKATYLASRSLRRVALALGARDVDAVFIQREAALVGPAYTEFILGSLKGLPIIFDFDDAIWHLDLPRSTHPIAARLLKDPSKCWYTMRHAACIIAGSNYLARRAREVNSRVEVVPTVVSAATWTPLPGRLDGELSY